jgi:Putative sensor
MATTTLSSSPTYRSGASRRLPTAGTIGKDALYLVAGLPAGVVTFSVLVTGLSLAAGLAITLLGIPVLLATLSAARAMGDVERRRAGWVLGTGPVHRTDRPWNAGGPWQRCKTALTDTGAWRDTVYGLILLPLGTFGFTVAVTLWTTTVGLITSPLWYWSLPSNHNNNDALDFLNSHAVAAHGARVAAGLVLLPIAVYVCRGLARATAQAARALLDH